MADALIKLDKNARAFNKSLSKLSKLIDADYEKVVRLAVLKVFTNIIQRSPVDTGAYRASHGITNTTPPSSDQGVKAGKEGGMTYNETLASMPKNKGWKWKIGEGSIWLFNNVPYALVIEEGHSDQAPKGVYSLALAEVAGAVQEQIKKTKTLKG